MGFDVLEVDAEVVGGVAESVGAEVWRQEFASLLLDVDAGGGLDGGDVFRSGEATRELFWVGDEKMRGRVKMLAAPDRAGFDPLTEVCFSSAERGARFSGISSDSTDSQTRLFLRCPAEMISGSRNAVLLWERSRSPSAVVES